MLAPRLLAVLCLVAACSGGDHADPVIDAAIDAPPGSTSVTFRLSYESDVPDSIFVQSGTESGGQGWVTIRTAAGAPLTFVHDCGVCNCDECGACAVCGIGQPVVTEIGRGMHLDWTWDARLFAAGVCPGNGLACETGSALPAGNYVARFCWSWSADGVGPGHHIGPVSCADEPFTWPLPAAAPVEHALCACG